MIHLVLFEPEIPPNTGNVIRLCANTGAVLHLVEPLGFLLDNKHLQRAGLDYHDAAVVQKHPNFTDALHFLNTQNAEIFAMTTKAQRNFYEQNFATIPNVALLFGPETRGLPADVLNTFDLNHRLRLPMRENQRSLNLSNSVAIATYEIWRQLKFS